MRTRNMRCKCSLGARPDPIQKTRIPGKNKARTAVIVNALEVQPPHLRYHPNTNVRLTIQATKSVTLIQSILSGSGLGGLSGLTKRLTSGSASKANGTFTQKIQRQERASLTAAVTSGV